MRNGEKFVLVLKFLVMIRGRIRQNVGRRVDDDEIKMKPFLVASLLSVWYRYVIDT